MGLKLYYFDTPGKAEAIRLALTLGKIDFEDIRITKEDWLHQKLLAPAGQVPYLTDGEWRLCESLAILSYVGTRVGLIPSDPKGIGAVYQSIMYLESITRSIVSAFFADASTPQEKERRQKECNETDLPTHYQILDQLVAANQGEAGFLWNNKLSIADLALYTMIKTTFPGGNIHGYMYDFVATPHLLKLYNAVNALPPIKEYYKA